MSVTQRHVWALLLVVQDSPMDSGGQYWKPTSSRWAAAGGLVGDFENTFDPFLAPLLSRLVVLSGLFF